MKTKQENGKNRLATVINEIPFYCSTGHSSNQSQTWLPFLGQREDGNSWIVKPGVENTNYWPLELSHFIQNLDPLKFSFKRFGTLQTMCISASLGGGYWLTEDGKKLKNYLQTNHPQSFLDEVKIEKINRLLEREENFELLISPTQINKKLSELGTIVILNSNCRLLPIPAEETLYKNKEIRALLIKLDQSILLTDYRIYLQNKQLLEAFLLLYQEKSLTEKNIQMIIILESFGLLADCLPLLNIKTHRINLRELDSALEIKKYLKNQKLKCIENNPSLLFKEKDSNKEPILSKSLSLPNPYSQK